MVSALTLTALCRRGSVARLELFAYLVRVVQNKLRQTDETIGQALAFLFANAKVLADGGLFCQYSSRLESCKKHAYIIH